MQPKTLKEALDELCISKSAVTGVIFLAVIFLIVCSFNLFSYLKKNREYRQSDEKYTVNAYLTGTSKYYNSAEERDEYRNDWQFEINGSYQHFEDVSLAEPSGWRVIEVYRNANGDFVRRQNNTFSIVCNSFFILLLLFSIGFVRVRHELLINRRSYQNR